jgi:hypothetical protein
MAKRRSSSKNPHEPTRFSGAARSPKSEDEYSVGLELDSNAPRLVAYGGPGKGGEFPLAGDELLIGRDPAADISVDDPSMSRRHAMIVRRRGKLFLRDLGSANGTYLDGVLHNGERPLVDGTRFRIGKTDFVVRDPETAKPE